MRQRVGTRLFARSYLVEENLASKSSVAFLLAHKLRNVTVLNKKELDYGLQR